MTSSWTECARGSVQTWECDQMGHMNVQFYVQRAEDAVAHLALKFGLGPSVARDANARLIPSQQHMRFHRELRPGAPYRLLAASTGASDTAVSIAVDMRGPDDATCFALTGDYQWCDADSRAVLDLPDPALVRIGAGAAPAPAASAPRGLVLSPRRETASLAEANALGLVSAFLGEVLPEHCDASGHMRVRDYMGRVSDGIPSLLLRTTGRDRSAAGNRIGGAALEYRFVYRKSARIGDLIGVRSGVKSIGAKTYNWVHWIVNEETGEALATAEAVAVAMDLDARKAIPIPSAVRALLEPLIVPGLSC